jgi:hypothetical protein
MIDYRARTLSDGHVDPHTVVFPILKELGPQRARLVGTGFFITMLGHFVTAKHVVEDVVAPEIGMQRHPLHALHFVDDAAALVRSITRVCFHDFADLAVGKMDYHQLATGEMLTKRIPVLTTTPPAAGADLVTFAYPESDLEYGRDISSAFRPTFYSGKMISASDRARDTDLVK